MYSDHLHDILLAAENKHKNMKMLFFLIYTCHHKPGYSIILIET